MLPCLLWFCRGSATSVLQITEYLSSNLHHQCKFPVPKCYEFFIPSKRRYINKIFITSVLRFLDPTCLLCKICQTGCCPQFSLVMQQVTDHVALPWSLVGFRYLINWLSNRFTRKAWAFVALAYCWYHLLCCAGPNRNFSGQDLWDHELLLKQWLRDFTINVSAEWTVRYCSLISLTFSLLTCCPRAG